MFDNLLFLWSGFAVCTALIVFSGIRLSKYGDILAEKSGLGRTWIGVVLMASVTSLPELVTGISSVTVSDTPDIAAGNVLGSCVFNMLILSMLDVIYRTMPVSTRAHHGNVLSGGFGILLLSLVCLSIVAGEYLRPFGWIGISTVLFIIVYFVAMRIVYFYEQRQIAAYLKEVAEETKYKDITMAVAARKYALNALVVIAAAVFLPEIGAGIAKQTGLGESFVGNVLIAFVTTLPEMVVSISAVKMDAIDLAIGNLFGSNIFNIFILAIDDFFYTQGALLADISRSHLVSALSAIAMTTIAIIGLTYRAEKRQMFLAWDSAGMLLVYIGNLMLLYMLR